MEGPYIKGMHYCDIFYNNCWAELIFTLATSNFKLPNQADVFKLSMRIIEGEGCRIQDAGYRKQDAGMAIADLLSCAPHFLEALFQACAEGKGDMDIDY